MIKGNLAVVQSGGPTAAINSSLAGVIAGGIKCPNFDQVLGAIHGVEGILNDRLISLNSMDITHLKATPGAYLGSSRTKLPTEEEDPTIYEKIFGIFQEKNITSFVCIGGNDSMDTVNKLHQYAMHHNIPVSVIGVPKTIDNDLPLTDHTPGFGSAAKYVATTAIEIVRDAKVYFTKSVTIIELMGRNSGWLTAATALVRETGSKAPQLVYLPEVPFSKEEFVRDVKEQFESGINNVVVAVSEGIKDKEGNYICDTPCMAVDEFGHSMLRGAGRVLESIVAKEIGCKARSVELNVMQRCAGHLLSKTDIEEAYLIGMEGVVAASKGESGKMMTFVRDQDKPYRVHIDSVPVAEVANKEKLVPPEFIQGNHDVSPAMLDYIKPLIQGELSVRFKNGLPKYLYRKKEDE